MSPAPSPKPAQSDPVSRSVRRTLARLGELWALPEFDRRIDVSFSQRLRSRLGRATPAARTVTLHAALASAPRPLLREVLCHEAAHVAVYWLHGADVRPHGPEWADLVRRAGYKPLTRLPTELPRIAPPRRAARRYEHLCPVCQVVRIAGRSMPRWRCQACVEAGLSGKLEIRRLEQ
jgi:predicted SprT family Zn-dependent metalloprotease